MADPSVETAEGRECIRKRLINSVRLDAQWPRGYDWCVRALNHIDALAAQLAEAAELRREVDEALMLTESCSSLKDMAAACVEGAADKLALAEARAEEREDEVIRRYLRGLLGGPHDEAELAFVRHLLFALGPHDGALRDPDETARGEG